LAAVEGLGDAENIRSRQSGDISACFSSYDPLFINSQRCRRIVRYCIEDRIGVEGCLFHEGRSGDHLGEHAGKLFGIEVVIRRIAIAEHKDIIGHEARSRPRTDSRFGEGNDGIVCL